MERHSKIENGTVLVTSHVLLITNSNIRDCTQSDYGSSMTTCRVRATTLPGKTVIVILILFRIRKCLPVFMISLVIHEKGNFLILIDQIKFRNDLFVEHSAHVSRQQF